VKENCFNFTYVGDGINSKLFSDDMLGTNVSHMNTLVTDKDIFALIKLL